MSKKILKALAEAPEAMAKGTYKVAKDLYNIGKRAVNPPLTNTQKRQMKSYHDWKERHRYDPN